MKWASEEAISWIQVLFNATIDKRMPQKWIKNRIKAIHKARERSTPSNYCTIMIGSTMAKLFGTIMENKISTWAEENSK